MQSPIVVAQDRTTTYSIVDNGTLALANNLASEVRTIHAYLRSQAFNRHVQYPQHLSSVAWYIARDLQHQAYPVINAVSVSAIIVARYDLLRRIEDSSDASHRDPRYARLIYNDLQSEVR